MEGIGRPTEDAMHRLPPLEPFDLSVFRNERFPTPLNSLGLVDPKALIAHINSVAGPDFAWEEDDGQDCHHLYWPGYLYPDTPEASVNPAEFRELPLSKILIPIHRHRAVHAGTERPEIPDREIMYGQIQAHRITQELYKNAWHAMRLERNRWISNERLLRGRDFHLEKSHHLLEEARSIPKEFQPIDFDDLKPLTIEEVQASARQLGQFALGASNLVRYVRFSAA